MRLFFVKLFALLTRVLVLPLGLLNALVFSFSFYTYHEYWAIPLLVCSLILIFPFRLVKSAKNSTLYFYLLEFASITLMIHFWFNTDFTFISSIIFSFIFSLLLVINLYFARLFLNHRRNPEFINPFLEKRDLKLLLISPLIVIEVLLGIRTITYKNKLLIFIKDLITINFFIFLMLIIAGLIIFSYLFLDMKRSWNGYHIISFPAIVPGVKVEYVQAALDSKRYKLEDWILVENHALGFYIIKSPILHSDYIELYENGIKIFRVDYSKDSITQITAYDKEGAKTKPVGSGTAFVRNMQGIFSQMEEQNALNGYYNKNKIDLVLYVSRQYRETKEKDIYMHEIQILVQKPIIYPQRTISFLPYNRSSLPWKLSLKDSKGSIPLIEKINLVY